MDVTSFRYANAASMMSDQASAMMVIGSSHSRPVISLFGNMACGKTIRMPMQTIDPSAATSKASQTTQTCGLSSMRQLLR